MSMPNAKERDETVRAVLAAAICPLTPTQIAEQIKEPWCCCGRYGMSAPISTVLKRIGAVAIKRGQWIQASAHSEGDGNAAE